MGNNDGGQNPSSWDSNLTLPGERANGPLSISVSSLQPGTVYYFSVRASNLAGSSWAQTFSFSTNSNNPPSQLNHSGSLQILENQPVGTIIGQFSASDPDLNSTFLSLYLIRMAQLIIIYSTLNRTVLSELPLFLITKQTQLISFASVFPINSIQI